MSRKTGMRGKAIAVICCLALLVGCTGCGALKEGSRRERQSQQGQSSQQGERIAPSYNTDDASKEAIRKLNDDLTSCSMLHVTDINTVYRLQLGNPKLLLNDKEVAADCLRKEGIKPKDYTADKLEKDLESGESAGLRDNRKALTCLVTAGVNVTASDETVWYPLK